MFSPPPSVKGSAAQLASITLAVNEVALEQKPLQPERGGKNTEDDQRHVDCFAKNSSHW
jgi:hypothetical protein